MADLNQIKNFIQKLRRDVDEELDAATTYIELSKEADLLGLGSTGIILRYIARQELSHSRRLQGKIDTITDHYSL